MEFFHVNDFGRVTSVELVPLPRKDEAEVPEDPARVVGSARQYFDQKTQKISDYSGRLYATLDGAVQRGYGQVVYVRQEIASAAEGLAAHERRLAGPKD